MNVGNPTFASLFSGCGGFDLGFLGRGFQSKGAFDSDPWAVANFSENLKVKASCVDLRDGIPDEEGLKGIDVLIAGPPCQGFSTAGKRRLDDDRNHLLTLTGTLAQRVLPKILIVENVSGVLSGAHARYMEILDMTMRNAGYRTHTLSCQSASLGMAQLRRRVLFFAWKTGRDIDFPTPDRPFGTLKDVLSNIDGLSNHKPNFLTKNTKDWLIAQRINQGQKLSNVRGGENSVATWDIPEVFGPITEDERTILEMLRRLRRQNRKRDYGDADPVSYSRLEMALGKRFNRLIENLLTKGYLRRIEDGVDLAGTFNGKYRRLTWSKPSCTVDTRFGAPRYFLHPSEQRGFTVREAARIQGFPDSYIFQGSEQVSYRLIGNAVPPPLSTFAAGLSVELLRKQS